MDLFNLSPQQKRNISKILPFGIICFLFGIVWAIVERSLLGDLVYYPPYNFIAALITASFGSLIFGILIGALEIFYLNRLFIKRPFGYKIIIQTSSEIYQYVGDEAVVSWKMYNGLKNNNCLKCFFMIKDIILNHSEEYGNKYGFVPGFKAGFHYGKVTTGEIGVVKKEIIFTGDVLNTTSRIQSMCNSHDVDILISNDLVARLQISQEYTLEEIGVFELRRKNERVILQTVEKV